MKRAIIKEYDQAGDSLSNYCAIFSYRLMNLCVKAEEVSLLPIEVVVEGDIQKLEECTTIAKKDEYSFMIFPNYDEDIKALGEGIMRHHPEFKQTIEKMTLDSVDEDGQTEEIDVRYILVTMPEVDDNRYDVLKEGVKLCYEECKAQMQAVNAKVDVKLSTLIIGETDEDVDKLKKAREKQTKQWDDQREKVYNEKLQEIEEAHYKWLYEKNDVEQSRQDKEVAHSKHVGQSMRFDSNE